MNKYKQRSTNMNKYQQIPTNVHKYEQIANINKDQRI